MGVIKLKENVYSVGVLNPDLRVFDIIMRAEYGTSYNAFLITGEKNILIDTVHASFFDEYISNIKSIVDISKIDALIMNHTEPDHSGSIEKLLALNPNITVYCTLPAKKNIDAITNADTHCVVVKQGDRLDIGNDELEFIIAPLLHWPDSMFTWMPSRKVLFTCDFLGCHYCEPTMRDQSIHFPEKYWDEFEYYYKGIFGPFKPYVIKGLDKIDGIDAELICPSHGPCLTENIKKCKELYRSWSMPKHKDKKTVAVLYASAYGYTEKLAKAACTELAADPALDVQLLNAVFTPFDKLVETINGADAVMVGSCTINRDAPKIIWDLLSCVDAVNTRGKPAGAFGSYGWSGEAVPMIKSRLEQLKFKFIGDGQCVNFMPSDTDISNIKAYARKIVSNIKS